MSSNSGVPLIIVTVIFATLSTVTTSMRLLAKILHRQLQTEDYTLFVAWLLMMVQVIFVGLEYQSGLGSHQGTLSKDQIQTSLKWIYASEFFTFPSVCLTKISICFFVLRIKNTRPLRYGLYTMMTFLIITSLMPLIVLFAQCRPLEAFWNPPAGSCWNFDIYNDIIWVSVAFSIFSDAICTLLPIVVLWNVKIALKLKVAVCGLMALGLLATICGGIRASLSGNDKDPDLTYSLAIISIWAILEAHLGVIGTNMALARYIWKTLFRRSENNTTSKSRAFHRTGYENYGQERTAMHTRLTANGRTSPWLGDEVPLRTVDILSASDEQDEGIRKTTAFQIDEERLAGSSSDGTFEHPNSTKSTF